MTRLARLSAPFAHRLTALALTLLLLSLLSPSYVEASSHIQSVVVGGQSPSPIPLGAAATYPISFTKTGSGADSVTLSVTAGLPTGATAAFSPNPVDVTGTSTLTITTTSSTPVGTYTFTVQAVADATVSKTGTLVVAKANTTTAVDNATATYGQTSVALTGHVTAQSPSTAVVNEGTVTFTVKSGSATIGTPTASGAVSGGAASVNYSLPAGIASGSYTIQATYNPGASNPNFNTSTASTPGTLAMDKRPITVTADAKSKAYGAADPALTYQITAGSLAGSDNFTGALTRAVGVNVGTYAIQQGTLALSNNYTLTYGGANLTITKATLTVTADAKSRAYGAANPTFTASYSGFVNGETLQTSGVTGSPSLTSTATSTSPVSGSPYTITVAVGSLTAGNYSFSFVNGSLTVTRASATTAVTSSANLSSWGQSVTFTAHVTPSTATGTVQFKIGGSDFGSTVGLSGGAAASSAKSDLLVGSHSITAVYSGDGNLDGGPSSEMTQTVNAINGTPGWASYDAGGTALDTFDAKNTTVYMKGTGYIANATYNIAYYDANGYKAGESGSVAANGSGALSNSYNLKSDTHRQWGGWHSLAQAAGCPISLGAESYSTVSGDLAKYCVATNHGFQVDQAAIPEIPTALAGLGMAALCLGIYYWMRKQRLAGVEA